jgi:hypothetical protein
VWAPNTCNRRTGIWGKFELVLDDEVNFMVPTNKRGRLIGLALASPMAISAAQAATIETLTLQIPGVGDSPMNCASGSINNCDVDSLPRVQCPAGETPISVTVSITEGSASSDLSGSNPSGGQAGCLQVTNINHTYLNVAVFPDGPANAPSGAGDLVVNGAGEQLGPFGTATCASGINNFTAPSTGVTPPPTLRFYGTAGASVSDPNILESQKTPASMTVLPSDANWANYYGDATQTIPVWLTAQAEASAQTSGSWNYTIATDAEARVRVAVSCRSDYEPPPVPAAGPLGLVLLTGGLAGLGAWLQGRRRRKTLG